MFEYKQTDVIDEETGIKTGCHIPEELGAAVQAKSELVGVGETWEAKKQQAAKAEQDLEVARDHLDAASRRGFRRPKAPEHGAECSCVECLRSDPRKAGDRVREEEAKLAEARQQEQRYSPGSAKEREAPSAALTALHDRYVTRPLDDLWAAYRRELKAEATRRKRHEKSRKNIAALPQLYLGG